MFTIGNEELEKAPMVGNFILCNKCGKRHKIKSAIGEKGDTLQFYHCEGKTYLAGINGKDITGLDTD